MELATDIARAALVVRRKFAHPPGASTLAQRLRHVQRQIMATAEFGFYSCVWLTVVIRKGLTRGIYS